MGEEAVKMFLRKRPFGDAALYKEEDVNDTTSGPPKNTSTDVEDGSNLNGGIGLSPKKLDINGTEPKSGWNFRGHGGTRGGS